MGSIHLSRRFNILKRQQLNAQTPEPTCLPLTAGLQLGAASRAGHGPHVGGGGTGRRGHETSALWELRVSRRNVRGGCRGQGGPLGACHTADVIRAGPTKQGKLDAPPWGTGKDTPRGAQDHTGNSSGSTKASCRTFCTRCNSSHERGRRTGCHPLNACVHLKTHKKALLRHTSNRRQRAPVGGAGLGTRAKRPLSPFTALISPTENVVPRCLLNGNAAGEVTEPACCVSWV